MDKVQKSSFNNQFPSSLTLGLSEITKHLKTGWPKFRTAQPRTEVPSFGTFLHPAQRSMDLHEIWFERGELLEAKTVLSVN
jgi:hypothetical protein